MHPHLAALLARPIAHRGLHGCGLRAPVENSLGAARAAMAGGFGIECDVQLSADGEAMVFHDARLDRLTAARGRVADWTVAALGALPLVGGADRIATLSELLATIGGAVPLVVEIKSIGDGDLRLAARVVDVLADYDGPVAMESFDPAVVRFCLSRGAHPVGLVGPADDGATDEGLIEACAFVSWSFAALDDLAARYADVPRSSWTIRSAEQAARARQLGTQIVFEGFDP